MEARASQLEKMEAFSQQLDNGVAILTFDQPGEAVNTLYPEAAREFEQRMQEILNDEQVRAVVLISGKKDNFIAGAKIDFLQTVKSADEATRLSKDAQDAFARVDSFPKPIVAAIHGSCLGGGLEWAQACDYRIVTESPKTTLGQPEVQLGLIPGAGGTQRLPRLIGIPAALDLILTGRSVKAQRARKMGLVDEVVPQPILLEIAKTRARELAAGTLKIDRRRRPASQTSPAKGLAGFFKGLTSKELWSELALEDNPVGRRFLFEQARKQLLKKTKGFYPAPLKALEAVRAGVEHGMDEGLKVEAKFFGELVVSDVSRRLVELFFASNELKKDNGTSNPSVKPREVKKVGILGGGLMGGGIAYVTAAQMGAPVRIKEVNDEAVGRALGHVSGLFQERVERRALTRREADSKMALVTASTDLSGFKNADLIIEAVFEDLKLKQQMVRDLEAVIGEQSIFASNTSSLPISQIAQASRRPAMVIGMHYFSPVNKMPLLEVVRHRGSADWVIATCVEVGKRQGKTVIVVNDGVGFYTSRIIAPYMNEASFLLAEGADIAELDRALLDFGFPVGPITLLDEVGIDVGAKVSKILHDAFGERFSPPEVFAKIREDGRTGRKGKKGFYTYNGKKKRVDETVYDRLPYGRERRHLDRQEIAERCTLQFINEAIRCLEEGILRSPRDGDIGAVLGLGFPPFLGGPFRYADARGPENILDRIEHWQEKFGKRFEAPPLLKEMARTGKKFYAA
jgi:3-hydroxyacyl-CoA dehydrogenase/enoyl-CoA hydratase/3-hydroxybutyryl-CoA epimerase